MAKATNSNNANATNNAARIASNNTIVRLQQRIAAALELRKQKHAARITARTNQAYMLAVQQLAAQYNMPVPNTMSVRPFNNAQKHAPSAVQGACAVVHEIAAACNGVRSAVMAECKARGINPATAATQFAKWQKKQKEAQAAQ